MNPEVLAVSLSPTHSFSKQPRSRILLLAGLGVEGDAHCGATVRHRYLRRRNPHQPNLTQVHLLHAELLEALSPLGFSLKPGGLGENITTRNINLLSLPSATLLHLGPTAIVEVTGLRTPCTQMDRLRPGLMAAFRYDECGNRLPQAGIMAIVLRGGTVEPGSPIEVELPPAPHIPLKCV